MDIVERLRGLPIIVTENGRTGMSRMGGALLSEAADEIERLRTGNRLHLELAEIKDAEIERLREALFTILCNTDPHAIRHRDYDHLAKNIFDCASAALKEKE